MTLVEQTKKGLNRFLYDPTLPAEKLHMHISEVAAGVRSHAAHRHDGVESIHVLVGEATLELEDERIVLRAGDTATFDPRRLHGLINTGATPNRYMVIIVR